MKFQKNSLAAALSAALGIIPTSVLAGGYALNEQSASAMGVANAGAAANAKNASVLFFNPAGIAELKGSQMSFGGAILHVQSDFSGSATNTIGQPVSGDDGGNFVPTALIPNFYLTHSYDNGLSVGFGLSVPFGLKGDYDQDFLGRFFADRTEIQVVDFQPTLAYKFNSVVSFGVGVDVMHARGLLSKAQDYSGINPALPEGYFEVKGDDWGFGWNAGLLINATDSTTIGLAYRSKVDFTLEGSAELSNVPTPTGNPLNPIVFSTLHEDGNVPLTTPESYTLSLKQGLGSDWTLFAGATYTRWSRFQNLDIFSSQGGGDVSALAGPKYGQANMIGHVPERWENTWAWSIGAAYQLNEQWQLKAGYAFDEDPVQKEYRTARVPSTDRHWLTVGTGWKSEDSGWSVDTAFGYLIIKDVELNEFEYQVDGQKVAGAANFQGTYDLSAWGVAMQLSKAF